MKTIQILFIALLFQACNQPEKKNDSTIVASTDQMTDSVTVINNDTIHTVYSAEEEAQIKKDSLLRVHKMFPYMAKYSFAQYKAPLYTGDPAAPDFKGNPYADDPEYIALITNGCKRGINFGGHYTIIEKDCGMMCEHVFMVDRSNGKIFIGTMGLKKEDGYYGFKFEKDSDLLIANATSMIDASNDEQDELSIRPEIFKWKNNTFIRLE